MPGKRGIRSAHDQRRQAHLASRALIAAVTEWARAQHCSRVYWSTQETNATARRLYDQMALNRGFILYQISL
jgi:hypothetical protein